MSNYDWFFWLNVTNIGTDCESCPRRHKVEVGCLGCHQ